jgi:site-specific recombinase XerD
MSGGASLPLIGHILGHKNTKTTSRYAHMAADPVRREVDRVSRSVASLLGS